MKIIVLLLISTATFAQMDFVVVKMDTCVSLRFSPVKDSIDDKTYVRAFLSIEQYDRITHQQWNVDTTKCIYVEVMFRHKHYTFKEFRKLIYE